ncbi:hypothetical protein BFF94_009485 [Burkholderia catarinensis]|nr:hypothetical protein BFF94_009485 [Burkholderia catarinensis]
MRSLFDPAHTRPGTDDRAPRSRDVVPAVRSPCVANAAFAAMRKFRSRSRVGRFHTDVTHGAPHAPPASFAEAGF